MPNAEALDPPARRASLLFPWWNRDQAAAPMPWRGGRAAGSPPGGRGSRSRPTPRAGTSPAVGDPTPSCRSTGAHLAPARTPALQRRDGQRLLDVGDADVLAYVRGGASGGGALNFGESRRRSPVPPAGPAPGGWRLARPTGPTAMAIADRGHARTAGGAGPARRIEAASPIDGAAAAGGTIGPSHHRAFGEIAVPLEFLRRRGGGVPAPRPPLPRPARTVPGPEEAVAQDHQLRLTYGAKTSVGVRMKGGPQLLAALPRMLDGLAITEVEVVEPRETTLDARLAEHHPDRGGGEWLRAHGEASPITRHALFVLESMDAIDPAYDTFACALLDGEVDPPATRSTPRSSAAWPPTGTRRPATSSSAASSAGAAAAPAATPIGTPRGCSGRLLGNILESGNSLGLAPPTEPARRDRRRRRGLPALRLPDVHPRARAYCPKCGMKMHA